MTIWDHLVPFWTILNQVGWLFRKEGMFKGQQRYWVLIYQGVMYIYKDANDKEPKERITLLGASLKKLKDKNKDGKGFMLQVGKKKEHTKYKTTPSKQCKSLIDVLILVQGH